MSKINYKKFMIEIIDTEEFQAKRAYIPFQGRLLQHWVDIRGNRTFPLKKDFRPQLFPNFLPQFAIIKLASSIEKYESRLLGTAVMEILGISSSKDHILATQNPYLSDILKEMLEKAVNAGKPSLYRMTHNYDQRLSRFDFTTLTLPFSVSPKEDGPEILILAFDFSESRDVQQLDKMSHPLYRPSNRPSMI